MEVRLIGAIDYKKLHEELKRRNVENCDEIIEYIKTLEVEMRSNKVAAAAALSRFNGDVLEILGLREDKSLEENSKYANRVMKVGHTSISDHDFLTFAIKDASIFIEQMIIAERFSGFTIKSRRMVDFSHAGYYNVPDFYDVSGRVIAQNEEAKKLYKEHMDKLFAKYSEFVNAGIPTEDARYIMPYCAHSNMLMTIDANTMMRMIIAYTKTYLAEIQELREFGEQLLAIARENNAYFVSLVDAIPYQGRDTVRDKIMDKFDLPNYRVLDHSHMVNSSHNIDNTILASALARRFNIAFDEALAKVSVASLETKEELMREIIFKSDGLELSQVTFQFQIPLSFAILTHLTRHRTHDILPPNFVPNVDLGQYKIPKSLHDANMATEMEHVFEENQAVHDYFKDVLKVRDEDLVHFTLAGNLINVLTNMDGKTFQHICELRECRRAQWETQDMAHDMHREVDSLEDAAIYSSLLGPSCVTKGNCPEGRQCCGYINEIRGLTQEEKKKKLLYDTKKNN